MNEFFTWAFLGTFTGAVAATALLTQAVKGMLPKLPTQILSYLIALAVLLMATAATGAASTWADWVIVLFNAVTVSLASNGAYEGVARMTGGKE